MVPDGVLPWWLSAGGWLIAAVLIAFALRRLRGVSATRMVPLVAVMTALMVVVMSLELVPIGYELHLTVLTGMIVGPWYGVVAAFLFNILRALIGDGAFTNLGLNTCIIWLEIALGAALWSALRPLAQRRSPALAAGIATFTALLLATAVFVGVIALSTVDPVRVAETGVYDVRAGGLKESPLSGGLFGVHFLEGEGEAGDGAGAENTPVGLAAFAGVFFVLAAAGALIESVITGAVVSFIAKVRPHLLGLRPTPLRTAAVASPSAIPEPVT
jgi:ABC-type Co2+ transport system permease subunit